MSLGFARPVRFSSFSTNEVRSSRGALSLGADTGTDVVVIGRPGGSVMVHGALSIDDLAGETQWSDVSDNAIGYDGQYVGIATTDPHFTLDVAGDINLTGSLYHQGRVLLSQTADSLLSGPESYSGGGTGGNMWQSKTLVARGVTREMRSMVVEDGWGSTHKSRYLVAPMRLFLDRLVLEQVGENRAVTYDVQIDVEKSDGSLRGTKTLHDLQLTPGDVQDSYDLVRQYTTRPDDSVLVHHYPFSLDTGDVKGANALVGDQEVTGGAKWIGLASLPIKAAATACHTAQPLRFDLPYSVAFWLHLTDLHDATGPSLIATAEPTSAEPRYNWSMTAHRSSTDGRLDVQLRVHHTGGAETLTATGLERDRWYHVALTCNQLAYQLHVDNVVQGTSQLRNTWYTREARLFLGGARAPDADASINGYASDLRIYSRALADFAELQASNTAVGRGGCVQSFVLPKPLSVATGDTISVYIREAPLSAGSSTELARVTLYGGTVAAASRGEYWQSGDNNSVVYAVGPVGIGTEQPQASAALDVSGNLIVRGDLIVSGSSTLGPAGADGGPWAASATGIYYSLGSVGIGKAQPAAALDVEGSMLVSGAVQAATFAGQITTSSQPLIQRVGTLAELDVTGPVRLGNVAADSVLTTDGSASISASAVSKDELANLSGSRSNMQAQIDALTGSLGTWTVGTRGIHYSGSSVGIGTTMPSHAKLEVQGVYGSYGATGSELTDVSIYASGRIVAQSTFHFSDARIKNVVAQLSQNEANQAVQALRPCSFRYRQQPRQQPDSLTYGFIAQEVERVLPHAVHRQREAVLTIGCEGAVTEQGLLVCDNAHGLSTAPALLRLVREGSALDVPIASIIDDHTLVLGGEQPPSGRAFVYGPVVDDFRVLDKDAILTVAVGAIQHQHKEISELRDVVRRLTERLDAFA